MINPRWSTAVWIPSGIVVVLLLLGTIPAMSATVSGVVTDLESGRILPFATVSVNGPTTEAAVLFEGGALGDEAGRYVIRDVPAGRYLIRVAFVTYEPFVDTLVVADQDVELDVVLTPSGVAVEKIVVEADRTARQENVQPGIIKLDVSELESLPAIGEPDPIRGLRLLPGVQAASDVSSGLYIRGGGPDQTMVLLDNVTIYNPTHAFGFFSTFNSDAIDNVTLYKGAYPAVHGGRLGSIVDVASRTPQTQKLTGKASISTTSARLTLEGPLGDNQWLVSGRRTYLEPILAALRKSSPEIPFYNFYDVNVKFATKRDGSWTEITAYHGRDDLRVEPDADTQVSIKWGNTVGVATYNRALANNVLGRISVSGSRYISLTDSQIFNTPFKVDNRLLDLSARAQLDWQGDGHLTSVGLLASKFDFQFDQSFNLGKPVGFRSDPIEVALYIDDQWAPRAGTSLRTGIRARYIDDGERLFVEPRLSISQVLPGDMRLKLGGGVYNQYLQLITTEGFSAADLYVPVDETATPSRSTQGVVGLEWSPSRTYQLAVEAYYTDLADLVTLDSKAPADQQSFSADDLFLTGGSGYASGLEIFAQRRVGQVTGWVGYTLGWSRRKFAELNGGDTYAPKYDRRHDLSVVLNYRRGPWSYNTAFVAATGQAFTPASARYRVEDPALGALTDGALVLPAKRNSARLLPYHRFDFSVTRDFRLFGNAAQWYVQIYNLYSRRNEWFVQFDNDEPDVEVVKQLPFIPSLGISFSF